jgi:hypothetical protein
VETTGGPEPELPHRAAWPKKDKTQKTTYSFGPDGQVNGLNVEQQLRLLHIDFAARERGACEA